MKKSVALSLFILVSIFAWADNTSNFSYTPPQINFVQINTPAFIGNNLSPVMSASPATYSSYTNTFPNDTYMNYNQTILDKNQLSSFPRHDTYYTDTSYDKTMTVYSNNGSSYPTYTTNFPDDHSKDYSRE